MGTRGGPNKKEDRGSPVQMHGTEQTSRTCYNMKKRVSLQYHVKLIMKYKTWPKKSFPAVQLAFGLNDAQYHITHSLWSKDVKDPGFTGEACRDQRHYIMQHHFCQYSRLAHRWKKKVPGHHMAEIKTFGKVAYMIFFFFTFWGGSGRLQMWDWLKSNHEFT